MPPSAPATTTRRALLASGAATATVGCTDVLDITSTSPLTAPSDWPRPEYDVAATGRNADVSGPADDPSVRWESEVPVDFYQKPTLVVVDGTVFCAGGSVVSALDVADGSRRWQTRVSPERRPGSGVDYTAAVTVADGRVFVGNHDGLFALDTDGAPRWSHTVDVVPGYSGVFRSPAVTDGSVYFCLSEAGLLVATTTEGEQRWRYDVGGRLLAGPAVADGRVIVGDTGVGVHAVSVDGDHLWTAPVGDVRTTPLVVDGTVYTTASSDSRGHLVAALDATTGELEWSNAGGPWFLGSPTVVGDRLACTTLLGTVLLYDRDGGALAWGALVGEGQPSAVVIPASDGRRVYATGHNAIAAIDRGEGRSWSVTVESLEGNVAVTDGAVFVGSSEGKCYAIA